MFLVFLLAFLLVCLVVERRPRRRGARLDLGEGQRQRAFESFQRPAPRRAIPKRGAKRPRAIARRGRIDIRGRLLHERRGGRRERRGDARDEFEERGRFGFLARDEKRPRRSAVHDANHPRGPFPGVRRVAASR